MAGPAYSLGQPAYAACDLVISQGADQQFVFRYGYKDISGAFVGYDLSTWTARAQMRRITGDTSAWLTLTSPTNITLAADGTVTMAVSHTQTEGDDWNTRSKGVWDLELTSPLNKRVRLVAGAVTVDHDVTRDADGS